jgi:catechol 2,3-dioxygenase-like lactoylglutathione lyase family enzyme
MNILFIATVAVIAPVPAESRKLYVGVLGLPLKRHEGDDYFFSEEVEGAKHFGVWPLAQAAQACFGAPEWPSTHPVPQACIEFEVADEGALRAAATELAERGHALIHEAKMEPWGQMVARLQSAEGVIVGISFAPWLHSASARKAEEASPAAGTSSE